MSLAQLFYCREAIRRRVKRWHEQKPRPTMNRFMFEALEPRLLLSATPTEIITPQELTTAAVSVPAGSLPNLDVDLNGQADALSDGIVIIRHLFGFTGNALVDGVVDPAGQRTDPTAIADYLNSIRTTALDVDLNQQADALSDGIMIIRSLFGFSGNALTDGAIDPSGQRTDPAVIATFLDNMNPQRELIAPLVTAGLQNDTGISATDGITFNPTITGTIADINQIAAFTAGFDGTPVANFVDVLADLQSNGTYTLTIARLTEVAGGTLADGTHTLHLHVTDARGSFYTLDHSFLLDTTPPVVQVDQPSGGALVSDIVVAGAVATDDVGVAGIQFFVDAVPTGPLDAVGPYALTWDTRTVSNDTHTLTAQAVDTSGNAALSLPVTVNVSNTNLFRNEILATGFDLPTAIKFLPDGRLLVVELAGTIRILPAPYTQPDLTPFLQLSNVASGGVQQGIFDLALDPNFDTNHYYYIFYTLETPNRDRLSRFTANASLTGTVADSELVLYQDPQDASTDHHGGAINFGNDGMIYFTTGEHFGADDAQLLTSPRGKLHRINPDGAVPTDNPFYDGSGPNWDSIWAIGLRNPFRAYYDMPTGRLLIADVGGNDYSTAIEEVNIGVRGANYGWPNVEAPNGDPTYTAPAYYYTHIVNGTPRDASITGGFVYHGTQFPSSYQGNYFFADYTQNWIRRLTFDANGNVNGVFNFEPADGSVDGPYGDIVYLTEGPEGALYYLDLGFSDIGGIFGVSKLRRIQYIQSDLPPVVAVSATPTEGPDPLTVNFSSAGSSDPEGLPLTYSWNFGDGTAISTEANPAHTYNIAGPYQARLTVSDGVNSTLSPPLSISAGNRPVIVNLLATVPPNPSNNGLFRAGDVISYSGQATDIEDGSLSVSAFTWTIDFLHEGHVHPGTPITGVTSGSFQIPTSGHDFSGFTRYRITVTVTDSDGLQSSQSATVFPDKVNLTFETAPGGLTLYVDGIAHQAPFVYDTLIGFELTIDARDQTVSTSTYTFASWSDGGAQSHQIVVPESDQSYLATYQVTQASLAPLDLPSETLWDLRDAAIGAAQPGDALTRLDDFRQRGRFRGITGSGMTAVIIDTGIDFDHPFFGPDADHNGVADRIVFQYDFADHDTDASDRNGHGSHIASLIGSEDLIYPGLAPEADLIALKVFSDTGAGTFANVEQALQWVIAHAAEYSIDVVNLSLGDGRNWTVPGAQYGIGDEFAALADDGIVVVAAAGNNFFTAQSVPGVAYPAADPNVIGVGAVWTADFGGPWRWSSGAIDLTTGPDRIASFSQRDSTMTEVFAPGARLIGANHLGGTVTMQGTSQAAAYLSGTALLAQQLAEKELGRKLTPEEFTRLVAGTGAVILDGDNEQDNVVNTGETFSRLDVLQLAKGIHRYAAWERGEGGHHSHHGFALAYMQRCWVKDFVAGTAAESVHHEEELLIALPG